MSLGVDDEDPQPKRRLYALRDSGDITAIGRGLYRWTDAPTTDLAPSGGHCRSCCEPWTHTRLGR